MSSTCKALTPGYRDYSITCNTVAETTRKEQRWHFLEQPRRNAARRDLPGGGGRSWVDVVSNVPTSCRVSEHPKLPKSWAVLSDPAP